MRRSRTNVGNSPVSGAVEQGKAERKFPRTACVHRYGPSSRYPGRRQFELSAIWREPDCQQQADSITCKQRTIAGQAMGQREWYRGSGLNTSLSSLIRQGTCQGEETIGLCFLLSHVHPT
ncbi:hypothetical protein [Paenibacillus sp. MMS18-CY102]|uniref:hypothetical protein n=1 Tax=Paenibacillus sp. MMS18-CY102 TaxID=2682849 RepID=UPI001365EA80|nr:hypothetical protein [Paenibacillus sp. MMS18-CY102]MWC30387.1 hypothetical protein [Paenibacillus sp. MMS18-CY102]